MGAIKNAFVTVVPRATKHEITQHVDVTYIRNRRDDQLGHLTGRIDRWPGVQYVLKHVIEKDGVKSAFWHNRWECANLHGIQAFRSAMCRCFLGLDSDYLQLRIDGLEKRSECASSTPDIKHSLGVRR